MPLSDKEMEKLDKQLEARLKENEKLKKLCKEIENLIKPAIKEADELGGEED